MIGLGTPCGVDAALGDGGIVRAVAYGGGAGAGVVRVVGDAIAGLEVTIVVLVVMDVFNDALMGLD